MEGRARLIQQLAQAREKMRAVLADVDTQTEIYPRWTIKHVLAHIAGWDDACIASLRAHVAGDEPGAPTARGIDFYNAQSVETASHSATIKSSKNGNWRVVNWKPSSTRCRRKSSKNGCSFPGDQPAPSHNLLRFLQITKRNMPRKFVS